MTLVSHEVAEQVTQGPMRTPVPLPVLCLGVLLRHWRFPLRCKHVPWETGARTVIIPSLGRTPVFERLYLKSLASLNSCGPYKSPEKKAERASTHLQETRKCGSER